MRRGRHRHVWRRVDGILLLDKPHGVSSNDALQQVKRLFSAEKAGHTGSLDPLATGLLPICFGEATKLCGLLLEGNKHYHATVCIGVSTTTGDLEGEVKATSDATGVTEAALRALLPRFTGTLSQVPPMYSALKYEGQALYKLAREGQEVERPPREVHIHRLHLTAFEPGLIELEIVCSKGTYVRTLAEDIAAALGQQAHLLALRRVGAEPFVEPVKMVALDEIGDAGALGEVSLDAMLLPPVAGVAHWRQWRAGDAELLLLSRGGMPHVDGLPPGRLAVLDKEGRLRGLARVQDGRAFPERWLLVD